MSERLAAVPHIGYQNPIPREGLLDDGVVIQTSRLIVHGENFVSLLPQPFRNGGSDTFIYEETHLCRLHG